MIFKITCRQKYKKVTFKLFQINVEENCYYLNSDVNLTNCLSYELTGGKYADFTLQLLILLMSSVNFLKIVYFLYTFSLM